MNTTKCIVCGQDTGFSKSRTPNGHCLTCAEPAPLRICSTVSRYHNRVVDISFNDGVEVRAVKDYKRCDDAIDYDIWHAGPFGDSHRALASRYLSEINGCL